METYVYLACPFFAWLVAGCVKFAVNSLRAGRLAFDLIGYGGMPSNHAAITSSIAWLILFKRGVAAPEAGIAAALCFVVMLDAASLRRQVGEQAKRLNALANWDKPLRERMGHSFYELLAGVGVGLIVAAALAAL